MGTEGLYDGLVAPRRRALGCAWRAKRELTATVARSRMVIVQ